MVFLARFIFVPCATFADLKVGFSDKNLSLKIEHKKAGHVTRLKNYYLNKVSIYAGYLPIFQIK